MKSTLLFLFAALQTGFLFAQFDEMYLGTYRSDDGETVLYVAENGQEYNDLLSDEQKKNAAFVFVYETNGKEEFGAARKSGNNFTSYPTESKSQITFAFKNQEEGQLIVDITDKAGKKLILNKIDFSTYYDDEETYSDSEYTPDEENGDVYNYGDEETYEEIPAVFQFTRADQGELLLFMKDDLISISLTIPATKSCSELVITGDLIQQEGSETTYFYTDPSGYKLKAEMITKDENPGWKFTCAGGNCPDSNNKCGVWKEEFMLAL